MKLTIKNEGSAKYRQYRIMDRDKFFCHVRGNLENAKLIIRAIEKLSEKEIEVTKQRTTPRIKARILLQKIADKKGIDLRENFSQERDIVDLRFIFCKISIDNGNTLYHTGKLIKRKHCSVLQAVKKCNDYIETDPDFKALFNEINA